MVLGRAATSRLLPAISFSCIDCNCSTTFHHLPLDPLYCLSRHSSFRSSNPKNPPKQRKTLCLHSNQATSPLTSSSDRHAQHPPHFIYPRLATVFSIASTQFHSTTTAPITLLKTHVTPIHFILWQLHSPPNVTYPRSPLLPFGQI